MTKQTLYEFLGIRQDAHEHEIRTACKSLRGRIEQEQDQHQRQNQLIFLQHAENILTDPSKRIDYDARLRSEAEVETTVFSDPPKSSGKWGVAVFGLLLATAAWAWMHESHKPSSGHRTTTPTSAAANPERGNASAQNDSDSFTASLPAAESQSADVPAQSSTADNDATASKTTAPQYRVQVDGPYDQLLSQLTWSVFAIAGSSSFGTGVLIDDEKLLTNCHTIAHNAGYNRKLYAINSVTRQRVEVTRVAFMAYKGEDACLAIAPGLQGRPVQLGNGYALQPGSKLHNIGFALGKLTASDGQFLRMAEIGGQAFIESSNFCDHGVSGGPLVDDSGALVGLTTGGPQDRSVCYSLTIETAKRVLYEPTIRPQDFPTNYVSNVVR